MNVMTSTLLAGPQPRPPGLGDGADMFDLSSAGLLIADPQDAVAVARLAAVDDEDVLFLAIASEARGNQLILVVAERRDQLWRVADAFGRSILMCAASRKWFEEEGEEAAGDQATGSFYLDADTSRLLLSSPRSPMKGRVGALYRIAKSRELICTALHQYVSGELVPVAGDSLSVEDTRRVMEAQRLVATRFAEKLTLGSIARACGLNRTKLARGFREMFGCSFAEALSECRLNWASDELLAGHSSISQIAFSAGYLSHASFSRAFAKHFGVPPKHWRRSENSAGSIGALC